MTKLQLTDGLFRFRSGTWEWRLEDHGADYLRDLIASWRDLERLPGTEVLKSNAHRTVLALPATGSRPGLVVKRYHITSGAERLKYLFFASRARSEWNALHHLGSCGVNVPVPLAVGEERAGGMLLAAGLIMARVADAVPLPRWLEEHVEERPLRATLMEGTGREIARLHDAGGHHTDLHPGNVLVQAPPKGGAGAGGSADPRVVLVDHHVLRVMSRVHEWQRVEGIARLVHSLGSGIDFRELLAFLHGYDRGRRTPHWMPADIPGIAARLEALGRGLERTRLRSRGRRCWVESSEFARERRGGWRIFRRREFDAKPLIAQLSGKIALEMVFKERSRSRVGLVALERAGGVERVVVKEHEIRSPWKRLWHVCYPSPLERAWGAARALDVRGIPNPRALALFVRRRFGIPLRAILVTERAPGAVPLRTDLLDHYYPPRPMDRTPLYRRIDALAELARRLHDTGIYHRDLNPMNVLVAPGANGQERLFVIDLESIAPARRLTARRRRKNLTQLGLLPEGHILARDRLRFLHRYDRGENRFWTREWIDDLADSLARETIQILSRMSAAERAAPHGVVPAESRFESARRR
ncbi:MAG: lipopolysaccharide kinase InaA family protein [Planctomycetes bacterium]|nr:lipopolysaccharide kinase InaA family protein [Planctomycetota bacterium]